MAVISGRYGSVDFSAGQTYIKSWTLDYKADLYDSTNFDDSSGGRSYVSGFTGWNGSYEGFYSTGNTAVPGASAKITLRTSSTGTNDLYYGDAIIIGMAVGTGVDGLITQNYTFQGTGALATSTA
jgi:hypothetical protein